ncbi:F-box/kelch-repeat protein At3g06240-like [Salvia miltiorrhiza]|uniref:F-box/kelch-repeat protein At3g06240-like n=1 Tax=Salvia miltiorrhiza TaxID=226208 RepID=UPI0025AC2F51|nr:F-box/kelch-repeat protein At3g06240-like [Salvia miltiorrhiza]
MEIGKSRRKSLHLPEETIEEILSRLAVNSVLKFRCVSKSWGSLIDSERFIKTHHQNSIKNPSFPQQRLILKNYLFDEFDDWPVQSSLPSVLSEPPNTISLSPLAVQTNTIRFEILGCYNGLLCILEQPSGIYSWNPSIGISRNLPEQPCRIHLWNPSTGISKKLPEISNVGYVSDFGFGWVESSGEYKVFVNVANLDNYRWKWVGKVYSSKTKSWKTIEHCEEYLCTYRCKEGVFAGGKLYWTNYNGHKEDIIFLDLKSEVFGRIELPFDEEYRAIKLLGVLGGCLCALHWDIYYFKTIVQVWVMKKSWEKVVNVHHLVELLQPAPLVVGLKGEILVNCGSTLLVFDRQDNVFRCPKVCCDYRSTHVYVESLVSPEDL